MENLKSDTSAKQAKEQTESKKKTVKSEWDWKLIAKELAFVVARGVLTGISVQIGAKLYDYSFNRKPSSTSFALIEGGKKISQAV